MPPRPLFGFALSLVVPLLPAPAFAQFSGDLAFMPESCKAKRACVLTNTLTFVDAAKQVWRAESGDLTDGASIPDWAQSVIGGPWDESYLKAAILHDHYCDRRTRSWRDTHLMFYDALIALGVGAFKAKIMYYSVYLAGPKWIDVVTPAACEGADAGCVGGTAMKLVTTIARPAQYETTDLPREMAELEDLMTRKPDMSLREIEDMAEAKRPGDPFYALGAAVMDGPTGGRDPK